MTRPAAYRTADGKRIPGVTTIISRFKDSGGLIHWAWTEGSEGRDYRDTRDAAATAGHVAHELIEAHILRRDLVMDLDELDTDTATRAQEAFGAFLKWEKQTSLEIVATERALISEKYRYGGMIDAIGRDAGQLVIVDWKSGNRIYSDYLIQIAAYRQLWEENGGDKIDGFHLLRVGKELGDFHHHYWTADSLREAWEAFTLMRRLYEIDKTLKKAVG